MADPVLPPIITRKAAKAAGLKRYFTGKDCCAGHVAERRVSTGVCLVCSAEWAVAKREADPEGHRARSREIDAVYRARNPEKVRRCSAAYRAANREKVQEAGRARHKANAERFSVQHAEYYRRTAEDRRAYSAAYRNANRDKLRQSAKAWAAANPEKVRNLWRQRDARLRGAEGSHTSLDVAEILAMQKGKCALCKAKVGKSYDVDHIQPISKGGSNARSNLQVLCRPCNQSKGAKDPIAFARKLGLLL